MDNRVSIEDTAKLAQLNGNTTEIHSENIFRGRCRLLANIMSNGVVHDYNFDKTEIAYEDDEVHKRIVSNGVLSEWQILAILMFMRIHNMNLMSIFHVDSHNKYAMGMCNISRAMDTITFISPENNNWILDSILKKYNNNKTSMINHMAYASVNELDINQLVYTVNKHDEMVRVNKVAVGDDVVHIFESESICGLLTQNEIYMVECKEYTDFRRVVADIMMGLKEHFGSRHNIVVI